MTLLCQPATSSRIACWSVSASPAAPSSSFASMPGPSLMSSSPVPLLACHWIVRSHHSLASHCHSLASHCHSLARVPLLAYDLHWAVRHSVHNAQSSNLVDRIARALLLVLRKCLCYSRWMMTTGPPQRDDDDSSKHRKSIRLPPGQGGPPASQTANNC